MEFYTGVALFQTHDDMEHLAMMEIAMGKMPQCFARSGAKSKPEFFTKQHKLDWPKPKATRQSKKDVRATRSPAVSCIVSFTNMKSYFSFSFDVTGADPRARRGQR